MFVGVCVECLLGGFVEVCVEVLEVCGLGVWLCL